MNPNLEGRTFATNSGAFTATGAETVFDTTIAIDYCIDGAAYRKAAVTDGATPTEDGNTDEAFDPVYPNQACALVWAVDASGDVSLYQGPVMSKTEDGDLEQALQFPSIPVDVCPFAYTVYETDDSSSASGVQPGTDNWNATGVTATHTNILVMPGRPATS